MNLVILIGNLGRDPEMRYTPSGTAVSNILLITNEGYGDKKSSTLHNVVAWGKTAENAAKYLSKGDKICVEGQLRRREWEGQDGNKRSVVEVHTNRIEFINTKGNSSGGGRQREESSPWGSTDNEPRGVDPESVPF